MGNNTVEIEIKAYCDNPAEVRKSLSDFGAEYVGEKVEHDIYFNHPARDFGLTDEALRIRLSDGHCRITYKGPKLSKETKARVEHETIVSDFAVISEIFNALGFIKSGEIKKNREYYKLDDMEITLDRVDGLGDFVEIEKQASLSNEAEKEIIKTASRLGLTRFERRSYLELKYFT